MAVDLELQGIRLREHRWKDIPAIVEIANLVYADEPTTVEVEEHYEKSYPAANPRLRFVAEGRDGRVLGVGECLKPFWKRAPGVFMAHIMVHPEWRRRGIGRAMLAAFEPYGREQGATRLWASCREGQDFSTRFLEQAGFNCYGVRFESALDLASFDETRFSEVFDRVAARGYAITTLADARAARSDADRDLFEMYRVAAADVPLPGGAQIEPVYEEWRSYMLDGPSTDPALLFIAEAAGRFVGMTSIELTAGPAITSATAVLREHRGAGVATALKVTSLQALKARGLAEARTHNDTVNMPILHLNEKLGYRRLPGWLQWEKPLAGE